MRTRYRSNSRTRENPVAGWWISGAVIALALLANVILISRFFVQLFFVQGAAADLAYRAGGVLHGPFVTETRAVSHGVFEPGTLTLMVFYSTLAAVTPLLFVLLSMATRRQTGMALRRFASAAYESLVLAYRYSNTALRQITVATAAWTSEVLAPASRRWAIRGAAQGMSLANAARQEVSTRAPQYSDEFRDRGRALIEWSKPRISSIGNRSWQAVQQAASTQPNPFSPSHAAVVGRFVQERSAVLRDHVATEMPGVLDALKAWVAPAELTAQSRSNGWTRIERKAQPSATAYARRDTGSPRDATRDPSRGSGDIHHTPAHRFPRRSARRAARGNRTTV